MKTPHSEMSGRLRRIPKWLPGQPEIEKIGKATASSYMTANNTPGELLEHGEISSRREVQRVRTLAPMPNFNAACLPRFCEVTSQDHGS